MTPTHHIAFAASTDFGDVVVVVVAAMWLATASAVAVVVMIMIVIYLVIYLVWPPGKTTRQSGLVLSRPSPWRSSSGCP